MFTIILGSAIGFFCCISLLCAVALLILYHRRRKAVKTLEANSALIADYLKKGV